MRLLETPRLFLRHFSMGDARAVWRLSEEEAYRRWLPNQVYASLADAEKALDFLMSHYDVCSLPFVLAVVEKQSGELIGHVGLSPIHQGVEIGYAIGQRFQQRGYACEAVSAFSGWAMQEFGYDQLFAVVRSDNRPSQRVLEKAGFTRLEDKGAPAESIMYAK